MRESKDILDYPDNLPNDLWEKAPNGNMLLVHPTRRSGVLLRRWVVYNPHGQTITSGFHADVDVAIERCKTFGGGMFYTIVAWASWRGNKSAEETTECRWANVMDEARELLYHSGKVTIFERDPRTKKERKMFTIYDGSWASE